LSATPAPPNESRARGGRERRYAERAFVARSTLQKVERGEPSVSLGVYATVLFVLGLSERIAGLAEPAGDRLGLQIEEARLPKRIRRSPTTLP